MRHHAVLELLGEERAQFGPGGCGVILRQDNGVEARIPEPLIRVVILRRECVPVAARRAAIFLQKFAEIISLNGPTMREFTKHVNINTQIIIGTTTNGRGQADVRMTVEH